MLELSSNYTVAYFPVEATKTSTEAIGWFANFPISDAPAAKISLVM
jgi:hypothetical protein